MKHPSTVCLIVMFIKVFLSNSSMSDYLLFVFPLQLRVNCTAYTIDITISHTFRLQWK